MAQPVIEYQSARDGMYPKQREAIYDPHRISVIAAGSKTGKGQPLRSPVYTPNGPVRMGDLRLGDLVLTADGTAVPVSGLFPLGERDIYRVTFADGAYVECTEDHLWEVMNIPKMGSNPSLAPRRKDARGRPRVMQTSELMAWPQWKLTDTYVPPILPVPFTTRPVPIDPYLLGVLIGDGGLKGDTIILSCGDEQILDRVRGTLNPDFYELTHLSRYDYRIGCKIPYQWLPSWEHMGQLLLRLGLRGLGSHEKFIPDVYKYNSEEVRWEILRGIMDTDGTVNNRGQPMLEQTSHQLNLDVAEVVESLGGYTRTTVKQGSYVAKDGDRRWCRLVYRQGIVHPDAIQFFNLTRKRDKCLPKKKNTRRYIVEIRFSHREKAQCIQIDDLRGLYLTSSLIPTHNTVGCLAWLLEKSLSGENGHNYWWVAPSYRQAEIGYNRMKRQLKPLQKLAQFNATKMTITLPNDTKITFMSGEQPDLLYGEDVYAVVLDEASRVRPEAWDAIRSTLTATNGPVRMIGNVRGKKNWFYEIGRMAESGDYHDMAYHTLTVWDAVDAGVLRRQEIEDSRAVAVGLGKLAAWEMLYLAKVGGDGDNPFGLDAIHACTIDQNGDAVGLSTSKAAVAGVDLAGRGAQNINPAGDAHDPDYTAIVMLDKLGAATFIHQFRKNHHDTELEIVRRVGKTQALVDSTGLGDSMVERLQRRSDVRVEGFRFTETSRQDLLDGLAAAIAARAIQFPDEPGTEGARGLVEQLEMFEYEFTRRGVRFVVPPGEHEDAVMALALAVKKLPWRRRSRPPEVLEKDGGSRWEEKPDAQAWAAYQRTRPTQETVTEKKSLPAPVVVGNSSRWSGAG